MRLAVDTNRYADFARGDGALRGMLEHAEVVLLPFVVVAELRAGFAAGSRAQQNARLLDDFLAVPGVDVVFADPGTLRWYAAAYRQLRAQGTPIPTNDLWIAALVMQHDLVLCTRDRHFDHLPQLVTV